MSTEQQFPSLSLLYLIYEDVLKQLLDELTLTRTFITTYWTLQRRTIVSN